jgi:HK97 family phage major capsid protein
MTPAEIREFLEGKIAEMKTALEADFKGKFGDPDPDYQKDLDEKIGDIQDLLKELMKPKDGVPGAVDEQGDPWCGYDPLLGGGDYMKDIYNAALGTPSDKLLKIVSIQEEKNVKAGKAAGDGLEVDDADYGGFLAPEAFRMSIWTPTLEQSNLMDRVTVLPVAGNQSVRLPVVKDTDHSAGTVYGGIIFYDEGENDTLTESRPKFEMVEWNMGMQAAFVHASDAMMRFTPITAGAMLSTLYAEALAWRIDFLLLKGTGAGQPTGFLNADAKVSQAKETGQAADTIEYENLINMFALAINPERTIWAYNQTCFPQLASLAFVVGTGGTAISKEEAFQGRPDFRNEHMSVIGDLNDIALLDPSEYIVTIPAGMTDGTWDTSIHFSFDTVKTSFRSVFYMDGKIKRRSALTPRFGDDLAPVVTLAERA